MPLISRARKVLRLVPALVALLLAAPFAVQAPRAEAGGDAATTTVQMNAKFEVSAVGDRKAHVDIVFGAPLYAGIKASSPDARKFLQDMAPDRADYEMADASARYDDATSSVVLDVVEKGAAKNSGGGRWALDAEPDAVLQGPIPSASGGASPVVRFRVKGDWGDGVGYEGAYVCTLPAGASEIRWDEGTHVLSWRLEAPPGDGAARLTVDLRARDRLMSTIYKVYGLGTDLAAFWIAKTVFVNEGKGVARNLRVRYRLQGYGEWSPWEKHPEVVPGQTVVSVQYPVLDAAIAKLKTNTPANLLVEWSYEDASGAKHEDDASKRVVILGVNEFVFGNLASGESFGTWKEEYNNAPLLAAWVSRNSGAVKQFASMANRVAGGVGAATDDASALKVLAACYGLLQANDFTYQHPPSLKDRSVSFDPKDVQNVKFPPDTMRDRSGTCIDLAILYASMANAVGLEPHLALIPGHCFPVIRLPSGRMVGVETTGVQGGLRAGSAGFDAVLAYGIKEYEAAQKDGRIYDVDVRALWTRGIANPEIEDLPPDILERWGLTEQGRTGGPAPSNGGPAPSPAASGLDAALGLWGGAIGTKTETGTIDAFVVGIDKAADGYEAATRAEVTVPTPTGTKKVVIVTTYKGQAKDDALLFESIERKRTIDGGTPDLLGKAFLLVHPKGNHIEARVGNDDEGYTDFTLAPKPKDEAAPAPAAGTADAIRGSWGGDMSKASLGSNIYLDEMFVDVSAEGPFAASVRMNLTLKNGTTDVPLVILASYAGGQVSGGTVRWEKVPWHRTVTPSGQKDDIDGNPLVLEVAADGRLSGKFEGGDGFPFTLARRGGAPAPGPAHSATALDGAAGTWGGDLHQTLPDGTIESLVIGIDAAAGTAFVAGVRSVVVVKDAAGKDLRLVVVAKFDGAVEGDKIVFRSTSRKVAREGSEDWKDVPAIVLEVSLAAGKITGRMGSDSDGFTTFTLAKKP